MEYIVYTKDNCSYCKKLKAFMKDKGLNYIEKKYLEDFTKEDFLTLFKDYEKTYPKVIEKQGKYIGGYEDFIKYYKVYLSWS